MWSYICTTKSREGVDIMAMGTFTKTGAPTLYHDMERSQAPTSTAPEPKDCVSLAVIINLLLVKKNKKKQTLGLC